MTSELAELLRKCLVIGGPLADDAVKVIRTFYPHEAVNFLYPHDLARDAEWLAAYRKGPTT